MTFIFTVQKYIRNSIFKALNLFQFWIKSGILGKQKC